MPEIVDDTVDEGKSVAVDGVKYGLATGIGGQMLGPVGHAVGGVAAGAHINDQTLSTLAVANGINGLLMGGGGGGGGSRGTM
jgi:hypothetical protein